jgi:pyruvate-formate lyase-activating enzyme
MENNKSFCAVPFVSIMVNTDTTVRYCCMVKGSVNKIKKDNGAFYTCKDNFVDDAWNSQDMRNIRKSMIAGETISGCSVCYSQESSGRTSNRQHSINEWTGRLGKSGLSDRVQQAIDNDGIVTDDLVYLDLRLGNLCNLKCRMCNPWNSSQIAKEHIVLQEKNKEYSDVFRKTFGKFPISVMNDQPWFDHEIMWDQVISLIPTLKKVYMTGGEPTLIKNNFKFMEECIRQGRTDIVLFFNTNCTNVNGKFLKLIKEFDTVNINASIDGTGITNEYIRAPSDWGQIRDSVEKIASLPNVVLGITPTAQIYNMFNVVDLIRWVEDLNAKYNRDIFIDFLINHHPLHLNTNIVPGHLLKQVIDDITEFKNNSMAIHPRMTIDSLEGLLGHLKSDAPINSDELLKRFKAHTVALDTEREQYLGDVDVRLLELLND